jgi:hypothetical protein
MQMIRRTLNTDIKAISCEFLIKIMNHKGFRIIEIKILR